MTTRAIADGTARIKMPIELHQQLIDRARREGVSLNHLLVALVAGGVGFKLPEASQ